MVSALDECLASDSEGSGDDEFDETDGFSGGERSSLKPSDGEGPTSSSKLEAEHSTEDDGDTDPDAAEDGTKDDKCSGRERAESDAEGDGDSDSEGAEMHLNLTSESAEADITTGRSFSGLGLSRWLCMQLKNLFLKSPTPVQAHCIPRILSGEDVIGCSKTGTGKTLAFALPILNQLATDPFGIYAVIITPTRELAFQIGDQFNALGATIGLRLAVVVGGRDHVAQAKDLARRPHVVVATPGRLSDHIVSDSAGTGLLFSKIKFLVIDEADRILEGQYADSLRNIFRALPKKRQTLLFSATITTALSHLQEVSLKKPYFFEDKSEIATVEQLDQKYVLCPCAVKDAYLVYVVKVFHQRHQNSSILIFSHTCRECQALAIMFGQLGFQVGSLHSQISQKDRLSALNRFRSGRIRILICTDVAARGLDIQHVDLVVNHNVPQCPKVYVHRVGRSARAGRFGGAVTFVTQYDISLLQEVEKLIGKKLEKLAVSDKKVRQYVTQVLVAKREAEMKLERQNFGERKLINKRKEMLLEGLEPEEVEAELQKKRRKSNMARKRKISD